MKRILFALQLLLTLPAAAAESAHYVEPPYTPPKVVYDFYLDDPAKMGAAFHWVRALIKPLSDQPYNIPPDAMSIKVVLHGTEVVTMAHKNYEQYQELVEKMRYYASLGVEFKVCNFAAHDYGYNAEDFYEFVEVVPSAFAELAYWQQQGYALITPQVFFRNKSLESMR